MLKINVTLRCTWGACYQHQFL